MGLLLRKEMTPVSYIIQGHNEFPSGKEIFVYLSAKQKKQERSPLRFVEEELKKKVGTKPNSWIYR